MPSGRIWRGTVSFGLVSIPVDAVPAVRSHRAAFHLLHSSDNARVQRKMVCPEEDVVVHPEHIVLGYEFSPQSWVVVAESELEALEPQRSRTIEILQFVDADEISPFQYDRPYYLLPTSDAKPFRLLATALAESHTAGIAKFVLRARENLVAVRVVEGALCLFLLHFAHDIVSDVDLAPDVEPEDTRTAEILAEMNKMSGPFEPGQYADTYQEKVRELLAEKARTAGVVAAPEAADEEEEEETDTIDLVATLEESLARVRGGKG